MVNGSNKHALVRFLCVCVCASRGMCPHMHTRMDKLVPHFHVEVAVYKVLLYSRSIVALKLVTPGNNRMILTFPPIIVRCLVIM